MRSVAEQALETGYKAMATDRQRETEAAEWINGLRPQKKTKPAEGLRLKVEPA